LKREHDHIIRRKHPRIDTAAYVLLKRNRLTIFFSSNLDRSRIQGFVESNWGFIADRNSLERPRAITWQASFDEDGRPILDEVVNNLDQQLVNGLARDKFHVGETLFNV